MGQAYKPDNSKVDAARSSQNKPDFINLIVLAVISALLTGIVIPIIKEKLLDTPDYRIKAEIKAPLAKVDWWLVNEKTGERIYIPDGQAPNHIEVHLMNTGKKPIEKIEVVLEFVATGDFHLFDERCSFKPEKGLGKIKVNTPNNMERRIELDLFNPGEELMYYATATRPVTVIAYSRFPGLSFYQEYSPIGKYDNLIRSFVITFMGLSTGYGIILICLLQRRINKQYGTRNILSRGFVNVYWNDRTKTERVFLCGGLYLAFFSCLIFAKLISNIYA